jgi:hypothetical protein
MCGCLIGGTLAHDKSASDEDWCRILKGGRVQVSEYHWTGSRGELRWSMNQVFLCSCLGAEQARIRFRIVDQPGFSFGHYSIAVRPNWNLLATITDIPWSGRS